MIDSCVRTLKVGNGDGVSILGFLNAGSPLAFFLLVVIELESPTPSKTVYMQTTITTNQPPKQTTYNMHQTNTNKTNCDTCI